MDDHRGKKCNFKSSCEINPEKIIQALTAFEPMISRDPIKLSSQLGAGHFVNSPVMTRRDDEMKVNDHPQYSLSSRHLYGYVTNSQNGQLPVGLIAQLIEHELHKCSINFPLSFPPWFYIKRFKIINCRCRVTTLI